MKISLKKVLKTFLKTVIEKRMRRNFIISSVVHLQTRYFMFQFMQLFILDIGLDLINFNTAFYYYEIDPINPSIHLS